MLSKKPDISIIVPSFNEEKFLPDCLESLKNQDFTGNYEIIVVDNNSTDATFSIARNYGVRVISETKRGVCFARQRGVNEAGGDIIVSTDADCIFSPKWLMNIYKTFVENGDLIAVVGSFQFTPVPRWGAQYSRVLFKIVKRFYENKNKIIYVAASNFAFKRKAWSEVGGYDTSLTQGGDEYDLLRKLRAKGRIIYLHDNAVLTSSRRLAKGVFYSIFVTAIGYYLLDYLIATRITGRSIFGQYPPFRETLSETASKSKLQTIAWGFSIAVFLLISLGFIFGSAETLAKGIVIVSGGKRAVGAMRKEFGSIKPSGILHGKFERVEAKLRI